MGVGPHSFARNLTDATGKVPASGGQPVTYEHDSENRLLSATNAVWSVGYAYDPNGRRLAISSSQYADMSFVHAGDMEIAEYDSSATPQLLRRYVPGAGVDQRAAMISYDTQGVESARHYYHTNRLGSVIALVSGSGANIGQITDQYRYTPFGVEDVLNLSGNPFRYTGRRLDADTGLYYYRARYYSAEMGRFLQTDPVGYEDQMNLYTYVGNDPVNATDPTGLERKDITRTVRGETGCRACSNTYTITVETDLSDDELEEFASGLTDSFFQDFNGSDFGAFDSGTPGYRGDDGTLRNDSGRYDSEREKVRIGAQISRGVQTVTEEWDLKNGGYKSSFVYDPRKFRSSGRDNAFGYKQGHNLVITNNAVSAGIQQTIATSLHERLHYRWGAGSAEHQRVYNAVYDALSPYGFDVHYECLNTAVGCRTN